MIKLAELYSPHVLITRPPASFLKVTGDQKLRYDLEWPYMSTVLARFGRASKKGSGNAYDALTRECNWNKIYMFQICTNPFLACLFIMNGFYTKCVLMVV